jgi:prepilin-type N-terminal cleavage/methylation domain-containing protein
MFHSNSEKVRAAINRPALGFTLIELLLVIAILGVLTTLSLAMLRSASESAKVSATQGRIKRIEALLLAELERYEVRRLPMGRDELGTFIAANPLSSIKISGLRLDNLRKRIIQDLINCEMPRPLVSGTAYLRNPDLGMFPSTQPANPTRPGFLTWLNDTFPNPPPNRLSTELANYPSGTIQSWADPRYLNPNFNHPGEYLYEILTRIDSDGVPALETLTSTCFADTDEDGFVEVVDAWGEPLLWFIAQTDVVDPDVIDESYQDVAVIDWTQRQPNGMPVGYTVLDSTVPRDLQQIRITVFSQRLNSQGIINTD